jgi:hypothetical protein
MGFLEFLRDAKRRFSNDFQATLSRAHSDYIGLECFQGESASDLLNLAGRGEHVPQERLRASQAAYLVLLGVLLSTPPF